MVVDKHQFRSKHSALYFGKRRSIVWTEVKSEVVTDKARSTSCHVGLYTHLHLKGHAMSC